MYSKLAFEALFMLPFIEPFKAFFLFNSFHFLEYMFSICPFQINAEFNGIVATNLQTFFDGLDDISAKTPGHLPCHCLFRQEEGPLLCSTVSSQAGI